MKIAILYICTGKYAIFWISFFQSAQQYFLTESEKHYFVFTDDSDILDTDFIHVRYESPKGFPLDSILRFDMFLSIKEQLSGMDYVFFFNSNMQFVKPVGQEVLPTQVDSGLMAVLHPGYYCREKNQFPYERNMKSKAYIAFNKKDKYHYFMGSLNGGKVDSYMKLTKKCAENIQQDMAKGIIAIYHDESHLNQYLHGKDVLVLSPAYAYPEDWEMPFEPKVIILNKIKHGGKYFEKLPVKAYALRAYLKLKRLYSRVIWKFQ